MTLYEISSSITDIDATMATYVDDDGQIIDEQGVDTTTKALDQLDMELEKKVLDIACLVKSKRAEIDARKTEVAKQRTRIASLERSADWFAEYVQDNIKELTKYKDSRAAISWRKSTVVYIADERDLPAKFVKTIMTPKKAEIKQYLKDGQFVKGCKLVEKQNLQIK